MLESWHLTIHRKQQHLIIQPAPRCPAAWPRQRPCTATYHMQGRCNGPCRQPLSSLVHCQHVLQLAGPSVRQCLCSCQYVTAAHTALAVHTASAASAAVAEPRVSQGSACAVLPPAAPLVGAWPGSHVLPAAACSVCCQGISMLTVHKHQHNLREPHTHHDQPSE